MICNDAGNRRKQQRNDKNNCRNEHRLYHADRHNIRFMRTDRPQDAKFFFPFF